MSEPRTVKLFVKGNADIVDCVLAVTAGGRGLDLGVAERAARAYPGSAVEVSAEASSGVRGIRSELESGASTMIDARPDVVLLSVVDEVDALAGMAVVGEDAVAAIRADLVAAIELIKEKVGAHVLVANVSTYDPSDDTSNYHGLSEEPFSLRAHRLDLMLVGVSHETGISIVDVDRCIAELGAARNVTGPAEYGPRGCAAVADEVVRVLEDYGFFDERPLVAQVGAMTESS